MADSSANSIDVSLNYDVSQNSQETMDWDRVEENCDRESMSVAWGLYKSETVDCDEEAEEPTLEFEDSESIEEDDNEPIEYIYGNDLDIAPASEVSWEDDWADDSYDNDSYDNDGSGDGY